MTTSDGPSTNSTKRMRLRYAGCCHVCSADLPAGATGVYDRTTKTVACVDCTATDPGPRASSSRTDLSAPVDQTQIAGDAPTIDPSVVDADITEHRADEPDVDPGAAGASALREYHRRKDARESRVREAHPRLGGLILALSDEPQTTKAWATGARGERLLGQRLDALTAPGARVLHDRRIPRSRANIDHIVVGPAGVFVIDAKRYQGRPSLRVEGGILRPRTETLLVGRRDCTKQVDGVHKQVGLVRAAVEQIGLENIPITGMLCFVEADWPLFGGDFVVSGIHVLWPKKVATHVLKPGALDEAAVSDVHRRLAAAFPAS